jgi:hypothetical protein
MRLEQLTMAQERAEELYQECGEALKTHAAARRSEFTKELRKLYGQLRRKRKILNLPASFSKVGVFEDGNPRLALAPGYQEKAYFLKVKGGAGMFSRATSFDRWRNPRLHEDVTLPEGTFPAWPQHENAEGIFWPLKQRIETVAPDVPPRILMLIPKSHTLKPYHVLWEVENQEAWEESRPPKDPILLKRLTGPFWAVIGTWRLTKLERAVLRGRL